MSVKVDGVEVADLGVGGQGFSWVDETSNRQANVTYTNTTSKPIMVSISIHDRDGLEAAGFSFIVDGVSMFTHHNPQGAYGGATFIVPANSTYKVEAEEPAYDMPRLWAELK